MKHLRLVVDRGDRVSCVALLGDLDAAEVNDLERELLVLEEGRPAVLVLDLRELNFIDSHGLSALIDAEARARGDARRLMLTRPPDALMKIFRMTLLDQRFEWLDHHAVAHDEPGLNEALDRLRQTVARTDA